MSVPQIKDRPASALRAMFAGIGSFLSGKSAKDKMRAKPAAEAPADVQAPASPAAAPGTAAPQATAAPEAAVAESPAAPETTPQAEPAAEPEAAIEPDATVEPEAAAAAEAPAEPEAAPALPLPNYDELTVASLRARLRNLSNDDLVQLKEYEQAHQNRPEVVKMFSNRLIKMTSGMPKLES